MQSPAISSKDRWQHKADQKSSYKYFLRWDDSIICEINNPQSQDSLTSWSLLQGGQNRDLDEKYDQGAKWPGPESGKTRYQQTHQPIDQKGQKSAARACFNHVPRLSVPVSSWAATPPERWNINVTSRLTVFYVNRLYFPHQEPDWQAQRSTCPSATNPKSGEKCLRILQKFLLTLRKKM